jgi:replicative DNA helicase
MNAALKEIGAARHDPYDVEVEQALLGAMIYDNSTYWKLAETRLEASHFYDPLHTRIFERIAAHLERNERVNPLSLYAAMKADAGLLEIGGHSYLSNLTGAAPAMANVLEYARILRELATRRDLIRIGEDLVSGAYEQPDEVSATQLADQAASQLYSVAIGDDQRRMPVGAGDVAESHLRDLERGQSPVVAHTGVGSLDRTIGGLQAGDIIVIAGRSGMGKSILGLSIAKNIAVAGTAVEFYSNEMSATQNGCRVVANILFDWTERTVTNWVAYGRILKGRLSAIERENAALAARHMKSLPLIFHNASGLTMPQITTRARARAAQLKKPGVIFIDHLHKVVPANRRNNMALEYGDMMKAAEVLAKDIQWPVVVLAQLNRDLEGRDVKDKRPTMADLRQSGEIEESAAIIVLMYRKSYYVRRRRPEKGPVDPQYGEWEAEYDSVKNELELVIDKNRHDESETVKCFIELGAAAVRDLPGEGPGPSGQWWEER